MTVEKSKERPPCQGGGATIRDGEVARLRAELERFRAFVETSSDWRWECDADARLTYVSDNVSEVLGHRPAERLGLTRAELNALDDT
ncbi:MAG: PAS domain S-box protein [Alphaproteobacteria bacterium]|nr:PAS domain S-box protein [Alphaproteobacteria bacterium]